MPDITENGSTSIFEIFEALTFGELSPYKIGGAAQGQIAEADYPKVMSAINRGVNKIQLDLRLNENSVRLKLIEGVLTYAIHSKHSLITGTDPIKFVDDSIYQPFEDDILEIRQIFNKQGTELPINKRNRADSLFVPAHNVIQHPFVKDGDVLAVIYSKYNRPRKVVTAEEAKTTYLPIPDYTLEALYSFVASIMSAGISTQQEIGDSQQHRAEYVRLINELKDNPVLPDAEYFNTKLTDNGLV